MPRDNAAIAIKDDWLVFRFEKGIKLISPENSPRYRYFPDVYDTGHTIASLSQLPINMYFLDHDGRTVHMSDECARLCGFASARASVGKSLLDVSDQTTATQLMGNSRRVVDANEIKIIEEENHRKDGVKQQFLSVKAPWYGDDNQIIGSCGFSVVLGEHPLAESLVILSDLGLMNAARRQKRSRHALPTMLTKREYECLELILKGYTAKKIACVMGISYRTVEEYITNIKQKMDVKSKSELLSVVLEK